MYFVYMSLVDEDAGEKEVGDIMADEQVEGIRSGGKTYYNWMGKWHRIKEMYAVKMERVL